MEIIMKPRYLLLKTPRVKKKKKKKKLMPLLRCLRTFLMTKHFKNRAFFSRYTTHFSAVFWTLSHTLFNILSTQHVNTKGLFRTICHLLPHSASQLFHPPCLPCTKQRPSIYFLISLDLLKKIHTLGAIFHGQPQNQDRQNKGSGQPLQGMGSGVYSKRYQTKSIGDNLSLDNGTMTNTDQ